MNVIMFSPHFPPNYYHFAVALRHNGVNVLGLGDAGYDSLRGELRAALTEYYRVDDLHDADQLIRACGYFTHRYGKLDRIESHNEYWLESDARLRTAFNMAGPKSDDILWVKQKSRMKQVFAQAGIAVAPGEVTRTLAEAQRLVAQIGYPVIAKPDVGVGAAATYKLHNDAELQAFFAGKLPVDYILEVFVRGKLYSFDGLVDQDGAIVFHTSHFFSQGIMETVNDGLDLFYYSMRDLPAGLEEVGRRTVTAFGLRERFFHIEFFQVAEGEWVALELNMRPPGGLTMDMFNYANDADLYQEWANVVAFNKISTTYTRPYHCAYVGRKAALKHRLSHGEVLSRSGSLLVHHETIAPVLAPAIGDYAYLLRSPDLPTLQSVIDDLVA
ncbi:MAG: ATP-grasp domain-containing protein [Anaerolineae bacterium]|nr:ATP-grasp domain-containing protein [Anaerolineae bacterium]